MGGAHWGRGHGGGFFADVPDLTLVCDGLRLASTQMVYLWTFASTHSGTGRTLWISGREELDRHVAGTGAL